MLISGRYDQFYRCSTSARPYVTYFPRREGAWVMWTPAGPTAFDPGLLCLDLERLELGLLRHDGAGRHWLPGGGSSGCRPRGFKPGFHCNVLAPLLFGDRLVREFCSHNPESVRLAEELLALDPAAHRGEAALIQILGSDHRGIRWELRGWIARPAAFDTVLRPPAHQLVLPGVGSPPPRIAHHHGR